MRAKDELARDFRLYGGTGSWDFLLSANYTLRYQQFGFASEVHARLNTPNRDSYRVTNTYSAMGRVFYDWRTGPERDRHFLPHTGIFGEDNAGDYLAGEWISGTGGRIVAATAGIDVYLGRLSLQTEIILPFYQYLFGTQKGNGGRLRGTVTWAFGANPNRVTQPVMD
jgi:hypothetical protein